MCKFLSRGDNFQGNGGTMVYTTILFNSRVCMFWSVSYSFIRVTLFHRVCTCVRTSVEGENFQVKGGWGVAYLTILFDLRVCMFWSVSYDFIRVTFLHRVCTCFRTSVEGENVQVKGGLGCSLPNDFI